MSTLSLAPAFISTSAVRRSTVRLTRRGRLVVFLTSLFLVLGVAIMLAGGAVGTGSAGEPIPTEIVTVAPGDTLWDIADRRLGAGASWPAIYRLNRDVIGPDPGVITPGQRLVLPSAAAGGAR